MGWSCESPARIRTHGSITGHYNVENVAHTKKKKKKESKIECGV